MFPSPRCPRAGQSGLWQNWACGSNGDPPGARFGDHARRDARWTRAFQASTTLTTVPWGATAVASGSKKKLPDLVKALDQLLQDATAGDPMTGLKWTHK